MMTRDQRAELRGYLLARWPAERYPGLADQVLVEGLAGGGAALPIVAFAVSALATAASTGVAIYSQQEQADFASAQAQHNEQLATWQRQDSIQRASGEANRIEQAGRNAAEGATAAAAGSNLDTTDGSLANLFGVSAVNAGLDAQASRANGYRDAWGRGLEIQDLEAQRRQQQSASILGGIGTGLSGFGQLAVGAGTAYKQGVFG